MTNNTHRFANEVEEGIKDYLSKVGARLKASGQECATARSIQDDLEEQIRTLLFEKGTNATWNDLTAILSRMDSPDQFIAGEATATSNRGKKWGVGSLAALFFAIGAYALIQTFASEDTSTGHHAEHMEEKRSPVVRSPAAPVASADSNPAAEELKPLADWDDDWLPDDLFVNTGIPVAIASFSSSANIREAETVRRALGDGLINYLSAFHGIRVVEREQIQEALRELRMSAEGMIDQATALRLGRMVGARVIVTGNILQIDDELVITARLINAETSELVATRVNGPRTQLLNVIDELSASVAERMIHDERGVLARSEDRADQLAARQKDALQERLRGRSLPRVLVLLPESHLNRVIPDPAGETELIEWLLACGFPVAAADYEGVQSPTTASQWNMETDIRIRRPDTSDERQWLISSQSVQSYVTGGLAAESERLAEIADVLILGEGISERASARSGIVSSTARLELKVIDIRTGDVLLAKSTYGAGLDVAEHIAGKRALQAAGRQMAIDLIPELAQRWAVHHSAHR